MKKILLGLLIIPITVTAQPKIDGIGSFRIGKTTSSTLEQIASENNIKINTTSTSMDRYLADGSVYKTTKNIFVLREASGTDIEDSHYKYSKDVKVFLIDYIDISSVPYSKLYLSFYKDTLYSIYSEGSNDISEAMTTKYGEPELKVTKKKVKCTGRISGNFEVEEVRYNSQWVTGSPDIKAASHIGVFYNSKCEKLQYSYFSIENEIIAKKIKTEEDRLSKEKESAIKERNKKALTNF